MRLKTLFCLPLLLLTGCAPQLAGTTGPTDAVDPAGEEPAGDAYFAVLGPSASRDSTDVIVLDVQGNEVRRLGVGNSQVPFDETFNLSWHHAGFFLVSTASGPFLTAVDPMTRETWAFGMGGGVDSWRQTVAGNGDVVVTAFSDLYSLNVDGEHLEEWSIPLWQLSSHPSAHERMTRPLWVDAVETDDGMLLAHDDGRVTRLADATIVYQGDGTVTDFAGMDDGGALWTGSIFGSGLSWVEPGREVVNLGDSVEIGLHPYLFSVEPAGPNSVWVLNVQEPSVDAQDWAYRVSQVDRQGGVTHQFDAPELWPDLIVLDDTYPQEAQLEP